MKHNRKSKFEKDSSECPRRCENCEFFKPDTDQYGGTCTANGCKTLTYNFSRPTDRPLPLPLNCFWWYESNVWNKVSETKISEYREERLHLITTFRMLETLTGKDRRDFIDHVHRVGGYGLIDFTKYPQAKVIYQDVVKQENGERRAKE